MKYLLISIYCFLFSLIIKAQVSQPEQIVNNTIEVIGKSYLDSVIIRWAPSSSDLWLSGNNYGYRIIRKTVGFGDSIFNDTQVINELSKTPIKPFPLEKIKPIANNDFYAGIVAQAIYGNTFSITTQDPQNLINKAREIDNRFSFSLFSCDMSRTAAEIHGLIYTDKDVRKNGHYIYQILLGSNNENKYDTGLIYINVADTFSLPKPIELKALGGNQNITLRWNKKLFNDIYSAYIIERSEDGKKFIRRNNNPMVNLFNNTANEPTYNIFVDSIPVNQKNFIYRVRGISPLGEIGPPSDTVITRGEIPMYMMNPMITSSEVLTGGAVKINWEIPYVDSIHANEFQIQRAETSEGRYEKVSKSIVTGSNRSFIDNNPLGINYYVVEASDELGRRYRSFPSLVMLEDSVPPPVPKELSGICDSLGIIHLSWKPVKEKDLAGYKIFRYNKPGVEPMKINDTTITNTCYCDTLSLNTLTNYFYYSVASFDNHYNQSDYSEILKIRLYDTIAPPIVSFIKFENRNRIISLFWNKSISSDALQYRIYRKLKDCNNFELIAKCKVEETQYNDLSFKGNYNEYLITCIDEVGNESENSQILGVSVIQTPNYEIPEIFLKDIGAKASKLTYMSQRSDIKKVLIYRCINKEPFTLFSSQEFSKDGFTDTNLIIGNSYTYKIQFIYNDGSRSALSNSISILK
jgi:fibronectin type 3 domain-containing protein